MRRYQLTRNRAQSATRHVALHFLWICSVAEIERRRKASARGTGAGARRCCSRSGPGRAHCRDFFARRSHCRLATRERPGVGALEFSCDLHFALPLAIFSYPPFADCFWSVFHMSSMKTTTGRWACRTSKELWTTPGHFAHPEHSFSSTQAILQVWKSNWSR